MDEKEKIAKEQAIKDYLNTLGFDPSAISAKQIILGEAWVHAKHAAQQLKETKSIVLAEIQVKAKGKSESERKTQATADKVYRDHIESMCIASHEEHLAELKYKDFIAWTERMRTQKATEREEMRLTGVK